MLRLPGSMCGLILPVSCVLMLLVLQIQCKSFNGRAVQDDEIERSFSKNDCIVVNKTARPEEFEACELYEEYKNWNKSVINENNDCNWAGTNAAIKFMQTFLFEDKGLKDEDIWKHRMNMHRFRRFMNVSGFLQNPGSIHFRTHREKTLKLFCGNNAEKKTKRGDKGYTWTARGTLDDKEWNSDPPTEKRYAVFRAAPSYLYSQRYTCKGPKNCIHHTYVITRPYPEVTEHITIYEGSKGELTCSVRPCLYDDSADGCTDFSPGKPPKFFPPVEFYFVFPRYPRVEVRDDTDIQLIRKRNKMEFPGVKMIFGKNSTFDVKLGRTTKKVVYVREATIEFENVVKELHDGEYECVFVDYNGVTSSSPPKDIKIEGIRYVHVRRTWWLYLAISILCVIPIFSLIVEFCAPNRLEHEDGKLYTKAELEYNDHIKQYDDHEAEERDTLENEFSEINLDKQAPESKEQLSRTVSSAAN